MIKIPIENYEKNIDKIILLDYTALPKFAQFFKKISNDTSITKQFYNNSIEPLDITEFIHDTILWKSFKKTQNCQNISKPTSEFDSKIDYKRKDFIEISLLQKNIFLCFNIKDQKMHVLKSNLEDNRLFEHEIAFYEAINN